MDLNASLEVVTLENGLKISASHELELWRATTLFTKEPETIAWINKNAINCHVFYDIGANVGVYSIYAAYTHQNCEVYSFEPILSNYTSLIKNKDLNLASNLHPFNIALSENSQLEKIFLRDLRVGNSGAQIQVPIDEKKVEYKPLSQEFVISCSIDCLIDFFNFPVPNFIKIDVDGHEISILEGAKNTLKHDDLSSLIIECNGPDNKRRIENLLNLHGFTEDIDYLNISEHSSHRRTSCKTNNIAMNVVYSRK